MRSLYSKLAITTIIIMLLSGIISFFLSNFYYQQFLKKQNDVKMTNFALEIADFIGSQDIQLHNYLDHLGKIGYQLFIIDEHGNRYFFGSPYREKNLSNDSIKRVIDGHIFHGIKEFPNKTFMTGFFANELSNTVGVPFEYRNSQYALFLRPDIKLLFSEMHIMLGWLAAGIIAFSIVLVLMSTKYLINPISKLNKATALIAEGNFGIKLNIKRKDEIGDLAASFQTMAGKLEKADEIRKEFISNVSHDIQSPLSNMQGYLKLLKSGALKDQQKEYIDIIHSEVNRLSYLTKQLLLLSSIDSKKDLMVTRYFNIGEQIKQVIRQYHWTLSEKGMMTGFTLPDVYIDGDPALLYSIWENLLTNAIKYGDENGEIDISLIEDREWVSISFKDNGIGLTYEEMERIYDRFYRGDPSRTRTVEGTGLGLSIVSSIIHLHNGEIRVDSTKEKGSTFTVRLPKRVDS